MQKMATDGKGQFAALIDGFGWFAVETVG